ncbi:hypothetical protein, partial [Micromonospora sp. NPDC092111]|uniref:hypothetical protein n=1 Tax=Micromonospora sp. NPDC092111 TaxID=3364289 RepID=UPI0038222C94
RELLNAPALLSGRICPFPGDAWAVSDISTCNPGSDQGRLAQRTSVIPPESVVVPRCAGQGRRSQRWERLDREGEHDA